MPRTLLVLIAIALPAALGCTMCAAPFDECGPVLNGPCPGGCCSDVRAGSVLSPGAYPMAEVVTGEPTTADPSQPVPMVPGAKMPPRTIVPTPAMPIAPATPPRPTEWKRPQGVPMQ